MANSRPLIHNVNKPVARRKPSFSRPMKTRIKNRFLLTVVTASLGLILAGRYYWRMDVNAPVKAQPTSSFTLFLVNHRHQLTPILRIIAIG